MRLTNVLIAAAVCRIVVANPRATQAKGGEVETSTDDFPDHCWIRERGRGCLPREYVPSLDAAKGTTSSTTNATIATTNTLATRTGGRL